MIQVITSRPVAIDSPDHLCPFGTARDNSVHLPFNRKLYEIIPPEELRLLDLGCAGGGLVKSILDDGGFAVGIEGSDYSRKWKRAHWPELDGKNLFTADITAPVEIRKPKWPSLLLFNLVTAWEFFEHIRIDDLRQVMANIAGHANPKIIMLGSISTISDQHNGMELHQTIQPREWWLETFAAYDFRHRPDLEQHFGDDWLRGPNSAQPVPQSFFFALSY